MKCTLMARRRDLFCSLNRYFVMRQSFSTTTITIKQTYLLILCAYSLALCWTLMPVIGWSAYDYEVH